MRGVVGIRERILTKVLIGVMVIDAFLVVILVVL